MSVKLKITEKNICQNKLQSIAEKEAKEKQFIAEKEIKENQFNCEQCGEQCSGKTYLEEHRTTIHDSPEEDHSGKQVNTNDNVSEAEIIIEKNICQNELQSIAEKEIKEKQFNCEQCDEQFSGKTYLEEHRTIIHDSPEENYSGKQINVSGNVSDAEIEIGKNTFQNELQCIAEKEIKQFNCENEIEIEKNICQNKLQFIAEKEVKEKQFNCEQCGEQFSGRT